MARTVQCAAVLTLVLVSMVTTAQGTMCPDKVTNCISRNTCCPLRGNNDRYGCCPYPQAVCCADRIHCCPGGSKCDEKDGMCTPGLAAGYSPVLKMFEFFVPNASPMLPLAEGLQDSKLEGPAAVVAELTEEIVKKPASLSAHQHVFSAMESAIANNTQLVLNPCPDRSVCAGKQTCCSFGDGSYGCCPFEKDLRSFGTGNNVVSIRLSAKLSKEFDEWSSEKQSFQPVLNPSMFPALYRSIWVNLFVKYNTSIPSSAAVERLFSVGSGIMRPKRSSLTSENFERFVLLKGNRHLFK